MWKKENRGPAICLCVCIWRGRLVGSSISISRRKFARVHSSSVSRFVEKEISSRPRPNRKGWVYQTSGRCTYLFTSSVSFLASNAWQDHFEKQQVPCSHRLVFLAMSSMRPSQVRVRFKTPLDICSAQGLRERIKRYDKECSLPADISAEVGLLWSA